MIKLIQVAFPINTRSKRYTLIACFDKAYFPIKMINVFANFEQPLKKAFALYTMNLVRDFIGRRLGEKLSERYYSIWFLLEIRLLKPESLRELDKEDFSF